MRELLADIRLIIEKDRQVFIMMAVLLALSVAVVIFGIVNIRQTSLPVWYRYMSFSPFYERSRWYYMISFVLGAFFVGAVHNIIAIRLYKKLGRIPTLLFVVASIFIVVFLAAVMANVFGINRETGIWI